MGRPRCGKKVCSVGSQQSRLISRPRQIGPARASRSPGADEPTRLSTRPHDPAETSPRARGLSVGKENYTLLQFHFHRPSEHKVAGKSFPMESAFRSPHGSGALRRHRRADDGRKANPAFAKIVQTMPTSEGPAVKADAGIDPNVFLPPGATTTACGSLTTPPCRRNGRMEAAGRTIQGGRGRPCGFAKLYPMNARPVQKDFAASCCGAKLRPQHHAARQIEPR